jgi:hypothetical protein
METLLTGTQERIKESVQSYLSHPVQSDMPVLVLAKHRKYNAVFRLYSVEDETLKCSFYRERTTEEKLVWKIHDLRDPEESDIPPNHYIIRYEFQPVLSRPGVTTGLFHTLNRLDSPVETINVHYATTRETREECDRWLKKSYTNNLVRCVVYKHQHKPSWDRTHVCLTLSFRRLGQLRMLSIYEDCHVDNVRDAVTDDDYCTRRIYTVCVDTRFRTMERDALCNLEQEGKIQLVWCQPDVVEYMDMEECQALLMLLRMVDDEPLATMLDSLTGPAKMPRVNAKIGHLQCEPKKFSSDTLWKLITDPTIHEREMCGQDTSKECDGESKKLKYSDWVTYDRTHTYQLDTFKHALYTIGVHQATSEECDLD